MKKTTKRFAIIGVGKTQEEKIQSLIELESLIVLYGYFNNNTEERWNNRLVKNLTEYHCDVFISCYSDGTLCYQTSTAADIIFESLDVKSIIKFLES